MGRKETFLAFQPPAKRKGKNKGRIELSKYLKIFIRKENKRKEIVKMKGATDIFETIKNRNNVNRELEHRRL